MKTGIVLEGGAVRTIYSTGVCDALLRRGVIVRGLASYQLPAHIRVSVGTAEENALFLAALADVLPGARA